MDVEAMDVEAMAANLPTDKLDASIHLRHDENARFGNVNDVLPPTLGDEHGVPNLGTTSATIALSDSITVHNSRHDEYDAKEVDSLSEDILDMLEEGVFVEFPRQTSCIRRRRSIRRRQARRQSKSQRYAGFFYRLLVTRLISHCMIRATRHRDAESRGSSPVYSQFRQCPCHQYRLSTTQFLLARVTITTMLALIIDQIKQY
jgi:hypothetical protein